MNMVLLSFLLLLLVGQNSFSQILVASKNDVHPAPGERNDGMGVPMLHSKAKSNMELGKVICKSSESRLENIPIKNEKSTTGSNLPFLSLKAMFPIYLTSAKSFQ